MNINTDHSIHTSLLSGNRSAQDIPADAPPPPAPLNMHGSTEGISAIGQQLSQLSDEQKTELQNFMDKIHEATKSGELDAEALAEQAPEFLQTLAEEQNVDLTELVTTLSDMPPPMPKEDMQAVFDFHEQVLAAADSGEFDAEALAENAPDAVVAMAEQHGVDVADLITWMSENEPPPAVDMPPSDNQGKPLDVAAQFQEVESEAFSLANILTRFSQT